MGADRGQHQKQSPSEVPVKLREAFGVTLPEAYDFWKSYTNAKLRGASIKEALCAVIDECPHAITLLEYFAVLTLEHVTKGVVDECEKEKH